MAADDDGVHFEGGNGVGESSEEGNVGRVEDVGNVAMGEDLAWLYRQIFFGGGEIEEE